MARTPHKGHGRQVCSFCGKHQDQVRRLIAGPGVFICDECIQVCNEILVHERPDPVASAPCEPTPEFAMSWWRRLIQRWWVHRTVGMFAHGAGPAHT
jgi:hypothetical protein